MSVARQFGHSNLSAKSFAARAYRALEELSIQDLRLPKNDAKALIEEVWPLTVLLSHLDVPRRQVRCRYVGDTEGYDARITLRGHEVDRELLKPKYFVEVTTAASPVDYLRREALERNGGSFGGDDIRRVGSRRKGNDRIVSMPVVDHPSDVVRKTEGWVRTAIAKKGAKQYPSPCILLINARPGRSLALSQWVEIAENTRTDAEHTSFCSVFAVDVGRNLLLPISISDSMAAVVTATHAW